MAPWWMPTALPFTDHQQMPAIGDELHCGMDDVCRVATGGKWIRSWWYLIVPWGAPAPTCISLDQPSVRNPRSHKVIEGSEIKEKTNLSAPHTVHCLGSDIIISMLGDAKGEAPGGFPATQ